MFFPYYKTACIAYGGMNRVRAQEDMGSLHEGTERFIVVAR